MSTERPFPPHWDDYTLAHRCPRCGAAPWTECTVKAGTRRFHVRREDVGNAHRNRDIGRAPWREDREPGQRYDTIDYPDPPPPGPTGEEESMPPEHDGWPDRDVLDAVEETNRREAREVAEAIEAALTRDDIDALIDALDPPDGPQPMTSRPSRRDPMKGTP